MSERQEPTNAPEDETTQAPEPGAEATEEVTEETAEALELRERVAELEDLWRRAVAELDNQRKRFGRELEREIERERERVSAQWLTVVDNLERALEHADADPRAILNGVRAVRDQAVDVLTRLGFPRRDDVGQSFDPVRHSAVATRQNADVPPGTIVEVLQPGYGDGDHQLRPALVVVAQKAD
jgi:molecular chaperone GrpE